MDSAWQIFIVKRDTDRKYWSTTSSTLCVVHWHLLFMAADAVRGTSNYNNTHTEFLLSRSMNLTRASLVRCESFSLLNIHTTLSYFGQRQWLLSAFCALQVQRHVEEDGQPAAELDSLSSQQENYIDPRQHFRHISISGVCDGCDLTTLKHYDVLYSAYKWNRYSHDPSVSDLWRSHIQ